MRFFTFRFLTNNEQRKHVAKTLNTVALGQLAAFGYAGLSNGNWSMMGVSVALAVLLELLALRLLRNLGDSL
ncbi:MAG: hypothetical protein KDG52_20835 [Rhodocyclaceae bacterium]|nr:hypothetical protein [Rhodocyclaceae bacterium]